mgnify:CR=1 FL=1
MPKTEPTSDCCHVLNCLQTWSSTQRPIGTMSPVASAMLMKAPGLIRPRAGCCQRTSASRPTVRPEAVLTIGCRYATTSLRRRPLTRSSANYRLSDSDAVLALLRWIEVRLDQMPAACQSPITFTTAFSFTCLHSEVTSSSSDEERSESGYGDAKTKRKRRRSVRYSISRNSNGQQLKYLRQRKNSNNRGNFFCFCLLINKILL